MVLGEEFPWTPNGSYRISQEGYAKTILAHFNMADCNPVSTLCLPGNDKQNFVALARPDAWICVYSCHSISAV